MTSNKKHSLIDVGRFVLEMERELRTQASEERCMKALAVLHRWQWDEQIDAESRSKSQQLVAEYDRSLAGH